MGGKEGKKDGEARAGKDRERARMRFGVGRAGRADRRKRGMKSPGRVRPRGDLPASGRRRED